MSFALDPSLEGAVEGGAVLVSVAGVKKAITNQLDFPAGATVTRTPNNGAEISGIGGGSKASVQILQPPVAWNSTYNGVPSTVASGSITITGTKLFVAGCFTWHQSNYGGYEFAISANGVNFFTRYYGNELGDAEMFVSFSCIKTGLTPGLVTIALVVTRSDSYSQINGDQDNRAAVLQLIEL
jgi:hypothetical protein